MHFLTRPLRPPRLHVCCARARVTTRVPASIKTLPAKKRLLLESPMLRSMSKASLARAEVKEVNFDEVLVKGPQTKKKVWLDWGSFF